MKKQTALKIISAALKVIPLGVYVGFNFDKFYTTAPKGITISSIFLFGAALVLFGEKIKKWISSPSLLKYVSISWIMSLIFILIGDSIFTVSSILLASILASLPIDAWEKNIAKESVDKNAINNLKNLITGNK